MSKVILEGFERWVLFRLTRFVAISAIFVLLGLVTVGSIALIAYFHTTTIDVTPEEVISSIVTASRGKTESGTNKGEGASAPTLTDPAEDQMKLPFILQKYFDNHENIETLRRWMSAMNDSEKRQYLDQLAQVVAGAEKANVDAVQAINKFQEMKITRFQDHERNEADRKAYLIWFAGLTATSLILIALLSLTLVLLAVERNTRQMGTE
jgi:hypothetical protein